MHSDEPEATRDFQPAGHNAEEPLVLTDTDFLLVWERFQGRLRRFLERRMPNNLQVHTNASDVMQSAFLSLWRYLEKQEGTISLGDEELWRILVTIAKRKLSDKWRKLHAKKRGEGRVVTATDLEIERQASFDQFVLKEMDHEVSDILDEITGKLEEECQVIASMRLAGMTNAEIASALNCSLRRIERKLHLIRSALGEMS
ncbi:sigma-70 family RNA polymerase sigma factor [Bremerella sp. P1]|uniref:sigma-70 family RNA polymerase sigma factor n=1 Tax=Bremerella sp. P1 TaxID=3026424 RepID=UPI002368BF81|nr:sigma-70 family RNA polymerase sigma factor [Bremerella sp. P1]WDI41470.1 sigma-70 family RNA polymerase sigma factor [Bremerella sp. P1]